MQLTNTKIEKIAATIVAGMMREAAYVGEEVTAAQLSSAIMSDLQGETAAYFRRSVLDVIALMEQMEANPELLELFGGNC